jgi:hypothetical protein
MSAASAYAVLVGWWLTAYVAAKLAVPVRSIAPLFIGYLVLFLTATLSGQSWFYREAMSLSLASAVGLGAAQAAVVVSPILFEGAVRQVLQRLQR